MSSEAPPPLLPLVADELARRGRWLLDRFRALSTPQKAGVVVAGLGVVVVAALLSRGAGRNDGVGEARVLRGSLRMSVSLSGSLAPAHAESYGAEIPGVEMKILELAPEGTRIETGTRLIRFDDAPFRRELDTAEGRRIQTRSEAEQARQALIALEAARRTELTDAEAAVKRTELDLRTFVNGSAPLAIQQSAAAVERARREAEDAKIKLEGLEPFAEKGYVSREELRAAKLRADQAEADLFLAEQQHKTTTGYAHPQILAQKTAEWESRREALLNLQKKGEAQIAQTRAAHQLADARSLEAERNVAEARRRIELCDVRAKSGGLVVYREIFEKAGDKRRVRVGDAVFAGQPVLDLPDLATLELEGRVRESDIYRIEPGQRAEVRLDAFPDRTFSGRVVRLGALANGEKSEARTFPLVLALSAKDPLFRPGMSGRAVVNCGEVANALQIPIDAVRYDGNQASVVVRGLSGTSKRRITTGKSNAFYVEVKDGLSEGDVVLVGGR